MKCKKCGNNKFHFTEGTRRVKIKWKLLFLTLSIFFPYLSAEFENTSIQTFSLYCGVISITIFLGIIFVDAYRKRRTYTKAICTECHTINWMKQ